MSQKTIRPGLTAATRVGRELLAAGWVYDSTTEMADDSTERLMRHPSGREIAARTSRYGDSTDLTMTNLTLEQVADAITAAGLTGPVKPVADDPECLACRHATSQHVEDHLGCRVAANIYGALCGCPFAQPAKPDYWLTLADDLRAAADKIATLASTGRKPNYVHLLINNGSPGNTDPSRAELVDTIAAVFGVAAVSRRSPAGYYEREALTSQGTLRVLAHAYVPAPDDPEKAALAARVAELEAQLATGGEPR